MKPEFTRPPLKQTIMVSREVMYERARQYREKKRLPITDDTYFDGTLAHAAAYLILEAYPQTADGKNVIDWP